MSRKKQKFWNTTRESVILRNKKGTRFRETKKQDFAQCVIVS